MTEEETARTDETPAASDAAMAEVDHTHPHTDEPFGEPFRGGSMSPTDAEDGETAETTERDAPEIRTDGGESIDGDEREEATVPTMADVDHAGADAGVSASFERGRVRKDDRR